MNRVANIYNKYRKFSKYVIVGLTNSLLTGSLYYVLLRYAHIDYMIAFSISWVIGVLYTYVVNYVWVFKPSAKIEFKRRLWKYSSTYILSYIVNMFALKKLVTVFRFDPFWAQVTIIPIIVAINYTIIKNWAMKSDEQNR